MTSSRPEPQSLKVRGLTLCPSLIDKISNNLLPHVNDTSLIRTSPLTHTLYHTLTDTLYFFILIPHQDSIPF